MTIIDKFISKVQAVYKTGAATEHSYRSAIEALFGGLADGVTALNEPKRVACGAPDFIIQRGEIAIGHVEAKDLGVGLSAMKDANRSQLERYRKALPNLIYTNCLDWDFYRNGELIASVTIADFLMGIQPHPDQFVVLENLLRDFIAQRPQTITSPKILAELMAGKAGLIKDVLYNAITADKDLRTELASQFEAFKEHLIHDITREDFADIYAETIAYGMFAARLHDHTLDTFSRQEALELLPKSNPFLRSLFSYIAGPDLDDRIKWIIDDLAQVFQAANVHKLMEGFGKLTGKNDPFLHFYETFLAAYNPAKRKARGVWYTPEAVVDFIVRAVDDVLQSDFGLSNGVADTSKVIIDWDTGQTDKKGKPLKIRKEVHRVQILDPAAGTGTFLADVIKLIAPKVKDVAPGMWSNYVEQDLIPRLHGFEILMASYAMCHMKLDMILTSLGYNPTGAPPRLSVYLTNSLEEGEPPNQTLPFAQWLSNEVKQANTVKRDMPIMCVIGNPPYNPSSKNNSDWIKNQLRPYKEGLGERKINLDDDYIKFIRLAETFIERNGGGVVAMITNNSYLDGATQRLMRKHLRETFEKIFILNLHGDIRNESTESNLDENVFDITQGVSIAIMSAKVINRTTLADVYYADLIGKRKEKYEKLQAGSLKTMGFQAIAADQPRYGFKPQGGGLRGMYDRGLPVNKIFKSYSSGVQTKRDKICVAFERTDLLKVISDFKTLPASELRSKYTLPKDGRDWTIEKAKEDIRKEDGTIIPFLYKPFDKRFIYYSGRTKGFVAYPRREVMQNVASRENVCLITNRQTVRDEFSFALVTDAVCCHGTFYLGNRGQDYCFPLYLYPTEQELDQSRSINFDSEIYKRLQSLASHPERGQADELAVFDYIYGVLHCPAYRETYAEFLRMDFPRIPLPPTPGEFWQLSDKGAILRRLHLMEKQIVGDTPFPFKGEGNGRVTKPRFGDGKVWINDIQHFENVPEASWEFYVGGYQPAQKWLEQREGRSLSFDEIEHYQRILKIMAETEKIMSTITMALDAADDSEE